LFNLIIGLVGGEARLERVLEHTDDTIQQWVSPAGILDYARLRNLPTLLMPELQDTGSEQTASVGMSRTCRPLGDPCDSASCRT
jgi:hypothetical protein